MALKLMYITNRPDVAQIAENSGVDRIFVDMEFIGKGLRQRGMDSVQNHHTVEDVKAVRQVISKAELLVRVNPIHDALPDYPSSKDEIDAVIAAGADIVMLPYFKTLAEVQKFLAYVGGRARTMLLLETSDAVDILDYRHSPASSPGDLRLYAPHCRRTDDAHRGYDAINAAQCPRRRKGR